MNYAKHLKSIKQWLKVPDKNIPEKYAYAETKYIIDLSLGFRPRQTDLKLQTLIHC